MIRLMGVECAIPRLSLEKKDLVTHIVFSPALLHIAAAVNATPETYLSTYPITFTFIGAIDCDLADHHVFLCLHVVRSETWKAYTPVYRFDTAACRKCAAGFNLILRFINCFWEQVSSSD